MEELVKMAANYKVNKITYNVDMVFCIDVTGSMENIINIVQSKAMSLCQDICESMKKKDKHINTLRVRIVAFRDYLADGKDAMLVTKFFTLSQNEVENITEANALKEAVSSLVADGGGDDPEDGLEALAYAIKESKWNKEGAKKRHVIVLWTDDDAHELGHGKASKYYPQNMATDISELTTWWGDETIINQEAKRLILFAPDVPGWSQISENWDKVIHYPSEAGKGLADVDYAQIISVISQTI